MSSGVDYVLRKIASHRLCKTYGWDPYIVWGFAKSIFAMNEELTGSGKRVLKFNGMKLCSGTYSTTDKSSPDNA